LISKDIFCFEGAEINPFFILHGKFALKFKLFGEPGIHLLAFYDDGVNGDLFTETDDYF
jgi:hypothetical protein